MPASTRQFPSPRALALVLALAIALALGLAARGALAEPLYAAVASGGGSHASAIDGAAGSGVLGGDALRSDAIDYLEGGAGFTDPGASAGSDIGAAAFDDAGLAVTACRFDGACHALRLDSLPPAPAPEPGAPGMIGFGLALVLLRGQRPANLRFRAQ